LPQSSPKYCRYMTPLDISSDIGYINPVINDDQADPRLSLSQQRQGKLPKNGR
jgi:hypothetical protein